MGANLCMVLWFLSSIGYVSTCHCNKYRLDLVCPHNNVKDAHDGSDLKIKGGLTLRFKTKETPKLSNSIHLEHNLGHEEITLGSKSKVWNKRNNAKYGIVFSQNLVGVNSRKRLRFIWEPVLKLGYKLQTNPLRWFEPQVSWTRTGIQLRPMRLI